MLQDRSVAAAVRNTKNNKNADWNVSASSSELSSNPEDASNRIFDGYARVRPEYHGKRLNKNSPVFAMGSCFAREIESALISRGCNVVSIDGRIEIPEFQDARGGVRAGFFHRFTPMAMLQEFQLAFGELEGWNEASLIFGDNPARVTDANYWHVPGSDTTLQSTLIRRKLAAELVRASASADIVILTLGLVESWLHKPTGFHANRVPPGVLIKRADEFELRIISVDETLHCLNEIRSLLKRHRSTPFEIVVTVSPVPLQKTWTNKDIIIANLDSKSTLRAAAAAFCQATDNAHYFPSYEMVTYSNVDLAWRPDRVHVNKGMVKHIVETFTGAYYEENTF